MHCNGDAGKPIMTTGKGGLATVDAQEEIEIDGLALATATGKIKHMRGGL